MLEIENLDAGYRQLRVLHGVTITLAPGEAVGVLGPNGAGKSTLLRAIAGNCNILGGHIAFSGQSLDGMADHARAALGIAHVLEGRHIWPSMTVEENLMLGAWRLSRRDRKTEARGMLDYVLDLFPRLRERLRARAGVLSGGEQQMVAIGRALMTKPSLMLVDEPSIGLAPIMVDTVMKAMHRLRRERALSIILVEQRIQEALDLCDRIYILNRGRLQTSGQSSKDLTRKDIEAAYFRIG
jgi:branched-chain amino acid transport system ATP-binding protein